MSDSSDNSEKTWSWDEDEWFKDWPLEARLRKQGITWGEEYHRNNPPDVVYGDPMPDSICQNPVQVPDFQETAGASVNLSPQAPPLSEELDYSGKFAKVFILSWKSINAHYRIVVSEEQKCKTQHCQKKSHSIAA